MNLQTVTCNKYLHPISLGWLFKQAVGYYVGFEVLAAVSMEFTVSWDVRPYSLVYMY
jgi:hypothetical protein